MTIRKLLLFDIDGTLLKSHGASRDAKARAIEQIFGVETDVRDHPFGGKTDQQILREVLAPFDISHDTIRDAMPTYQDAFAEQMAAVIDDFPVEALAGSMSLISHLRQQDDLLLGIVTGNTERTAPVKLRAAGFDPAWFPVGAYGNESADRNDLPELARQRAIQYSGVTITPPDVIVIGDTVADVQCARALGAVAVTVFTGFEDAQALIAARPDYLLDDLTGFLNRVSLY